MKHKKSIIITLCPFLVPTSPPQNVVVQSSTATQLDVTWDPPPLDAQNGDIQGYKVSIICLFSVLLQICHTYIMPSFFFNIFSLKNIWILHLELFYSVYRSISGSFSSRMRRSACVLCSCRSSGWSLRTWQATPPTWSVLRPSMLQGTGPAPCPPEGVLSKQVSYCKSRCGWGDYSDLQKTNGTYLAAKISCQHRVAFHSLKFCISLCLCLPSICLPLSSAQWNSFSLFNRIVYGSHVLM